MREVSFFSQRPEINRHCSGLRKNSRLQLALKTAGTVTTASNPPSQEAQCKAKVSGKAIQLNGNTAFGQESSWKTHRTKTHSKPGNRECETPLPTTISCSLCGNAKQKKIANKKAGNTPVET